MFYDLIIHPSRIEFFHRVFSPDKNDFTEKKIGSSELNFKFDSSSIGNGDNYDSFKKIVKELIDQNRPDFNSINIIVGPSFFYMKTVTCDKSKADYQEYINWEACQASTGQPEQYRYGYVFMPHDNKLLIGVVRKQVYDYFNNMLHEIYPSNIDCKLGCAYPLPNFKEMIVYADKQMTKPFVHQAVATKAESDSGETVSTAVKAMRSPVFLLILLFLMIIASSVALIYFAPDFTRSKIEKLASLIPSGRGNDQNNEPAAAAVQTKTVSDIPPAKTDSSSVDSVNVETPAVQPTTPILAADTLQKKENKPIVPSVQAVKVPAEVPVDPALDPHPAFWKYLISAAEVKTDSIVFINGAEIGSLTFFTADTGSIKKINSITLKNAFKGSNVQAKYIVDEASFRFINSKKRSNYNRFIELKTRLNINPPDPEKPYIFTLNSLAQLQEFLKGFNDSNVGFRKFVILRNGESFSLAVYFG